MVVISSFATPQLFPPAPIITGLPFIYIFLLYHSSAFLRLRKYLM